MEAAPRTGHGLPCGRSAARPFLPPVCGLSLSPRTSAPVTPAPAAAEYGLYGAFVPCIAYAVLGSSRQLAVGPVAVTSIMLANGLDSIIGSNADPNNPEDPDLQEKYNRAAIQVRYNTG